MPLVAAERDFAATQLSSRIQFISLHTGDPGTTGANEATGGNPAYARKAATWAAASGGSISAAEATFDVPAGTYTHFGYWTAATGGTFRGGNPLASNQTHTGQGQVKVTASIPVAAS